MHTSRRFVLFALGVLIAFGSWVETGKAEPTSTVSDSLTIFDPLGNVFASITLTEEEEAQAQTEADLVRYFPDSSLVDTSLLGFPVILTEPDPTTGQPTFSDVFGVVSPTSSGNCSSSPCFLGFESDRDPGNLFNSSGVTATILDEGDGVFDATKYLSPDLRDQGYTAEFRSDPVPEPSTAMLLATGMLSLAVGRRRR